MERTCCFCFDLKHGTLAVGIFTVTTRLIVMVALAALLGLSLKENQEGMEVIEIIYGVTIGECALSVLFGILLIVGVQKTIRGLFIPWMVLATIEIGSNVYMFFGSLFVINGVQTIAQAFAYLVGACFLVYQAWCVISYYRSLAVQTNPYQNFNRESDRVDILPAPSESEINTKNIA